MFRENTDTPVNMVSSRSAVNEPRIPSAPMASGRQAAVRLPKIISSRISRIGKDRASARADAGGDLLVDRLVLGTFPPTWPSQAGRQLGAAVLIAS